LKEKELRKVPFDQVQAAFVKLLSDEDFDYMIAVALRSNGCQKAEGRSERFLIGSEEHTLILEVEPYFYGIDRKVFVLLSLQKDQVDSQRAAKCRFEFGLASIQSEQYQDRTNTLKEAAISLTIIPYETKNSQGKGLAAALTLLTDTIIEKFADRLHAVQKDFASVDAKLEESTQKALCISACAKALKFTKNPGAEAYYRNYRLPTIFFDNFSIK